jgi:pimeloyl-ACP methyl ester carboxylesterase
MAIVRRESEQVESANASERTPVVFIHGLWLLPSSWQRWAEMFEEAGYAAVTPTWPGDPETVEEARAGAPLFQAATDNFNPFTQAKVPDHGDRGPLLLISGGSDHTVPWAITNASFKRQHRHYGITEITEIPNRGHALTIDSGWREVAETALTFVKRFV